MYSDLNFCLFLTQSCCMKTWKVAHESPLLRCFCILFEACKLQSPFNATAWKRTTSTVFEPSFVFHLKKESHTGSFFWVNYSFKKCIRLQLCMYCGFKSLHYIIGLKDTIVSADPRSQKTSCSSLLKWHDMWLESY